MKKSILLLVTTILLASCNNSSTPQSNNTPEGPSSSSETTINSSVETAGKTSEKVSVDTIKVTSSIVPLSSLINTIGGEYVTVNNIVPVGVSPHGFDLSAKQMAVIEDSQIVFLTGLEHIDGFLEKAAKEDMQVHLADGIDLLEASEHDHDEHEDNEHSDEKDHHDEDHKDKHEDEGHHDENSHSVDPHVWLGKENILEIAQQIELELSKRLPKQAAYFSKNTVAFEKELEEIYSAFQIEVTGKNPSEFIVFHDAYNYLFESIDLDSNLKIPFSENVLHESGTAHMAEIIEEIELHGVKYMFKEPQFSGGTIEKFATQYNLTLGTLDPLGTDESANGYLQNIRANLTSLAKIYE